jgi:hypothetical protein
MEKQQLRQTATAFRVSVFAFFLNYCYSLFLALYAEPIIGLNTPEINVIYGLIMGLPLFLICRRVLTKVSERKYSLDVSEGGNGSDPPGQHGVRSLE